MADDPAAMAAKAAKSAHRAMVLTMFAVAVAILVLAIDNSIKRSIITEAQKIRGMVGRFEEATSGLTEAVTGGTGDLPVDSAPDADSGGVADDPGTRTPPSGDANGGRAASARRAGSRKAGP